MRKILVIEDELGIRETLIDLLESHSYEVVSANNGIEGVEKALSESPDLILSDIMMPYKSGMEVLEDLINISKPELPPPFIFLTAKADHNEIRKGISLNADDYLLKPFKIDDLLSSVERNLNKRSVQATEVSVKEPNQVSTVLNESIRKSLLLSYLNTSKLKLQSNGLNKEEKKLLDQTADLLQQAIQELSDLSLKLIADRNLGDSVRDIISQLEKDDLNINLNCECSSDISFDIKYMVVNSLKVLLTSDMRHTGATRIDISIKQEETALTVNIDGFHIEIDTFYLNKVEEDILGAGGVMHIDQPTQENTKISFQLPLEK